MATDFPNKGDDKKISLRNSEYPQFDYDFSANIKRYNPEVWRLGGNIRGNEAFNFWTKARNEEFTEGTLDWIKEREAWAARHFGDGSQFKSGGLEPNKSNVGGVVAQMKWGVIGTLGEQGMKDVILELIKKLEGKKDDERGFSDLSSSIQEGLRNKVKEHNEEYGDDPNKRTNVRTLAAVFERGVGAYQNNPGSVRPGVTGPDQWAYARVNSFLFALRNGRFQGGKHDTDLLPAGHPESTKERNQVQDMEERHVQEVVEDDETVTIVFKKAHDETEEMEEGGMDEPDEERIDRDDLTYRYSHMHEKAIDEDKRTVRVGVSSEEPVKRASGMEIIDHTKESMNLEFLNSGRAPLLMDHDMERQIGVVESVELDEDARRLRALVRFGRSETASEVFTDVVDGIRQNISVGYRVDGRVERDHEEDHEDYYRVATTPMEISLVSIPADQSNQVGVGRSVSEPLKTVEVISERSNEMSEEQNVDLEAVKAEAAKTAQRNAKEIMTLARRHNKADLGEDALGRGISADQFRGELLDAIGNEPLETPAHVVDAPVKDQREYSLGRMIRAQASGDWSDAGFEREMHDEIRQRTGKAARGYYVPDFAWRSGAMSTAATGATGSENVTDSFVPTIHRGDMFIEALRANAVMANLGVMFMSGLTNRIQIPKFSTGATAGFVEELGNVADQSQTDASVNLQPRTMGAFADISRLLLKESIPAIDQVVQDDLIRSLASKLEAVGINGSGSSGEPTGILNAAGVGDVDISADTDVAALTWADLTNLVKTVEDADGIVNANTLGWLSNPKVKAKMANTVKVSSTDSIMLLNDPWNSIYGYPAEFTTNVPSNLNPGDGGTDASALIYGDFSQLMVGLFGAPDILIDETTGGLAGTVRIIVHQDVDIALRNAASFAKTDEVSTA
tara:strand:- start:13364 stop:16084 length:2721 start_codon:yes stop_codon:yes gene_type:complete